MSNDIVNIFFKGCKRPKASFLKKRHDKPSGPIDKELFKLEIAVRIRSSVKTMLERNNDEDKGKSGM